MNPHLLLDIWIAIQDDTLPAKRFEVAERLCTMFQEYGLAQDEFEELVGEDKILDDVISHFYDSDDIDEDEY